MDGLRNYCKAGFFLVVVNAGVLGNEPWLTVTSELKLQLHKNMRQSGAN